MIPGQIWTPRCILYAAHCQPCKPVNCFVSLLHLPHCWMHHHVGTVVVAKTMHVPCLGTSMKHWGPLCYLWFWAVAITKMSKVAGLMFASLPEGTEEAGGHHHEFRGGVHEHHTAPGVCC